MPGEETVIKTMSLREGTTLYLSGVYPGQGQGLTRGPDS